MPQGHAQYDNMDIATFTFHCRNKQKQSHYVVPAIYSSKYVLYIFMLFVVVFVVVCCFCYLARPLGNSTAYLQLQVCYQMLEEKIKHMTCC